MAARRFGVARGVVLGVALALGLAWAQPVRADRVHLKNGRVLDGAIVPQADPERISVQTASGLVSVARSLVEKIEAATPAPAGAAEDAPTTKPAAAEPGDLDAALALAGQAGNDALRARIEELRGQIDARDARLFGDQFDRVQGLIKSEHYQEAADEAQRQRGRAGGYPSVERHFARLEAEAHMGLARQLRDRVEYPKAEAEYREAIAADPEGPEAYLRLADLMQLWPSRKGEAIPLYRKGMALARSQPGLMDEKAVLDYQFRIGQLYLHDKDYVAAADTFLEVARRDTAGAHPEAFDLAAEAYAHVDALAERPDAGRLVANLRAIVRERPGNLRAAMMLARADVQRGAPTEARDVLKHALGDAPVTPGQTLRRDMLLQLGLCQRRLGETAAAAASFQALVDAGVAGYEAICELGELRMEQAAYGDALDLLNRAIRNEPAKYRAWLDLGDTLTRLERYADAQAAYGEVIKRDPGNWQALLAIGRAHLLEANPPAALEAAKAVAATLESADSATTGPTRQAALADAHTLAGQALLQESRLYMARAEFQSALTLRPNLAAALRGMGETLQSEGRYDDARGWFQRAIDAAPDQPEYRLSLGVLYQKYLRQPERALPFYMDYLRLGGKDPNVRRWIEECGGTPPPLAQPAGEDAATTGAASAG